MIESNFALDAKDSTDFQLLSCPNPLINEIYQSRTVELADGTKKSLTNTIPREEGDYLYSLVRHLQPKCTVEIGMANGLSTLFIASAIRENGQGKYIAIDPFQTTEWGNAGVTAIRRAGLDPFVEVIEKPSHHALPELEQKGTVAQFIYVDGNHLFDYVMTDFLLSDRILDIGGMIAFDDSDWPAIASVIRYIIMNRHYQVFRSDIVIENPEFHPTRVGAFLRWVGRRMPQLGRKLRADFLNPDYELGVRGRCIVLKKNRHEDRNGQSRYHRDF